MEIRDQNGMLARVLILQILNTVRQQIFNSFYYASLL
jgi:hypothetical protein